MSIKELYEALNRYCAVSGIELTQDVVDAVLSKLINEEGDA